MQATFTDTLREDLDRRPILVPLSLLGCKVETELLAPGDACTGASYHMRGLVNSAGGSVLSTMVLTEDMFAASAMLAPDVDVPFESMKVAQLKQELAQRGSTRSGLKMVLQRRLHGMLVQDAIAHHGRER